MSKKRLDILYRCAMGVTALGSLGFIFLGHNIIYIYISTIASVIALVLQSMYNKSDSKKD